MNALIGALIFCAIVVLVAWCASGPLILLLALWGPAECR